MIDRPHDNQIKIAPRAYYLTFVQYKSMFHSIDCLWNTRHVYFLAYDAMLKWLFVPTVTVDKFIAALNAPPPQDFNPVVLPKNAINSPPGEK